jgi:guanylate kinase
MKRLLVLSAPSGAGKTTLCQRLLRDFPRMRLSISTTTRAPRGQERHGREYFFASREEFEGQIAEGRFAEWARVHDNYYGTSRAVIEESFRDGRIVLLDIDVQGAASLRQAYPGDCFTIFVSPPDLATLEARLRARGTESEDKIRTRVRNAREEMRAAPLFDRIVVNDDLDRAYAELRAIVVAECGIECGGPAGGHRHG